MTYGNRAWFAIAPSTGVTPGTDSTKWALTSTSYSVSWTLTGGTSWTETWIVPTSGTPVSVDSVKVAQSDLPTVEGVIVVTGGGMTYTSTVGDGQYVRWNATAHAWDPSTLADVSRSGSYADLSGRPSLGNASALNVGTTAGTVAAGDDSRISNAMTGLSVKADGTIVGSRQVLNIQAGPGMLPVISDSGSQIDMLLAADTAVIQTRAGEQAGGDLLCAPTSGSGTAYACGLHPILGAYTSGMLLRWKPDVNGAGGATTLNVDTLGAKRIRMADGTGDPTAADIVAGRLYSLWYDGTQFRLAGAITGAPSTWPTFATVATSGLYSDLGGKPTLGGAAALNVGTTTGTVAGWR